MGYKSKIYSNMLASLGQARMLDDEKLRRLTDASYFDMFKILADYGYGDGETDIEKLISNETGKLISFVLEDCADDNVKDILLAKYVFNNAKAEYKSTLTKGNTSSSVYQGIEIGNVADGEYNELPEELENALISLDEKKDMGKLLPGEIDSVITKAMYNYVSKKLKKGSALYRYYTSEIDILNLISLLRCRKLGLDKFALAENLLDMGTLDISDFEIALESGDEAFESFYLSSAYEEVFGNVLSEDISDIEVRMDNYLCEIIFAGGDTMTGNAPFISYFYKQIMELKMIKMVVVCIKKDVSHEVRRRLRNIYD